MAKGITAGGGLKYKAQLDIAEALKNAQKLKAELSGMGIGLAKSFDTKPMTEYQAGLLRLKEDSLNFAKQKANDAAETKARILEEKKLAQEKAAAEKTASLALQAALKEERLAREANNKLIEKQAILAANARKPTQVSNSQAEIAKYNAGTLGTNGQVNTAFTTYLKEVKKDFDAGKISAQQYVAELERYSTVVVGNTNATKNQTAGKKQAALSEQDLARDLAIEKLKQQEATAALKNNVREMMNAKGSLEQRRAALIRLTTAYDRLSAVERNTAAGMRLGTIVRGVTDQIKELEKATGRAQRNVGNYGGTFTQLKEQLLSTASGYLSLYAVINAGKAIFENNVHLSDEFVDVQRTAKLSGEEVDKLGEKLKGINTRTSLDQLLGIGFEGGRLGVKKDEIFDFIKTVDQLAVVLKKELPGGAEAVSESLGKISKIYRIADREGISLAEAMNKVASSQLELAHDGGVTVKYLQDFSLGLAGTAVTAKLSLPVIEAYGSVLSNSGQIASSASLALTRVVNDLSVKREKYFAIAQLADANLTLKEFTNLINTDAKGALDLFFRGLKAGNPVQTELADRLNSVGLKTGKVSNAVKVLAENQELLAAKIGIASKAYDEGTSVAHNFELANNSLSASLDKIKNSIVNAFTDSAFSRGLAGLLNSLTDTRDSSQKLTEEYELNKHKTEELEKALKPLVARYDELKGKTNLNSTESDELRRITSEIGLLLPGVITEFGKYGEILDINRGKINRMTQAQRELLRVQNKDAVKEANRAFDDAITQQKIFQKTSLDIAKRGGPNDAIMEYRDYAILKAGDAAKAAEAIKKLGGVLTKAQDEFLKGRLDKPAKKKNENAEITGTGEVVDETLNTDRTPESLKAEIKALTAANAKLKVGSKELADGVARLKQLKKELRLALGGKDTEGISAENQYQSAVKARKSLQSEIDALTNKGRAKQLSDDAQELADVDAKYKKLREKAIAFNKDKKNKGLRVDTGGLLLAQSKEEDALRDKQNAATLKTTIDKEKKYYEEFEKYKSDFGLEKAKARYEKLINVDITYLESLKAKQAALLGDEKAKGGDAGGGEFVAKQQKVLEEAAADAVQEEQKRTDALLKEFMAYADKRKNLTEQYNSDIKALEANPGAQAERKKRYERDLKELDEANATQLESYQKLFENIEKLSVKSALQLVKTARKQLAEQIRSGAIVDPDEIKKINELFDTTEQTIREKNGQALKDLAGEVNNVASEVGALNEEFGKVLGTVGNVVGKIGEIKGFREILNKDSSSNFQKLTAGIGILGAGIGIFQSVISLFDRSAEREAQASYARDLQNKQTEALNKALERQVALLNDVYGTDRIKYYDAAIKQARENQAKYASEVSTKYLLTGNKAIDELIEKFNTGTLASKGFDRAAFNNLLDKGLLTQIGNSDINTLQRLLDEGKLDANTATIVTNLIKAKETAEQLVNNLRAETVGTTLDQIADDFISTLTDGVQDFGKTFEQTMQKSILNGFKGELIRKQLQAFYTQFATLSEGGLTSDEIETLRKSYLAASEKAKKDLQDLSKATGIDLTTGSGTENSSVGVIQKNVTESTATEWVGLVRSQYDIQKRQLDVLTPVGKTIGDMYVIAKSNFDLQVKIEANTYRTAENTEPLKAIRLGIDMLVKNTTPGSTGYDRGK